MTGPVEAPLPADLTDLTIEVCEVEDPDSVKIRAVANDGDTFELTWNSRTNTSFAQWIRSGRTRYTMTREWLHKISINESRGSTEITVWTEGTSITGHLRVEIGDAVEIEDTLLQGDV